MTTRVLTDSPALLPLYLKAAAPTLPGINRLPGLRRNARAEIPDLTLSRPGVRIDAGHLARYNEVCGFPMGDHLPPTYLHLAAFPLHLTLMTEPDFPFPAMGMVHLCNEISVLKPLRSEDVFDLTVRASDRQPHPRGTLVTVLSEATRDKELVWADESVVLARGRRDDSVAWPVDDVPAAAPVGPAVWSLPSDLGRRYASVSGDRNPIHLYDLTAKAFGFKRHIAHGLWTKARCLAELANRLPSSYTVNVVFRKPVFLPSKVQFGATQRDGLVDFGLTAPGSGVEHLAGRITPLS